MALTIEERRDEWRYQAHVRESNAARLARFEALVKAELGEKVNFTSTTEPIPAIVCFDSDVLPWPPCASHSWYRVSGSMAVCENCDYSASAPSPIADGPDGYIDDDALPNPPRPRLKAHR